jgi:hypothetical protein
MSSPAAVADVLRRASIGLTVDEILCVLKLERSIEIDRGLADLILTGKISAQLPAGFSDDTNVTANDFRFYLRTGEMERRS